MPHDVPVFAAPYAPPDEALAQDLLATKPSAEVAAATQALARELLALTRARRGGIGGVEDFLHEFALSSREGLAVMALAESLLRVPDDATLDRLLADRLKAGDFAHHHSVSDSLLVQACAFALGLSARVIAAEESPRVIVADLARRLGAPSLRAAARQAMRLMGAHFVYGETIESALGARQERRRAAIPSTCLAKRRAAPTTPSAISMPTPARSRHWRGGGERQRIVPGFP